VNRASREHVVAFGPGRVNLIGEHTDYNDGLALPFAIAEGVTVTATAVAGGRMRAVAVDHGGEEDAFALDDPGRADGWRAFVRGTTAELRAAGHRVPAADLEIAGDLPQGSGLSSSAALEVALCLALLGLAGEHGADRIGLARLCSRVENDWVGANTGLLDQLAALLGRDRHALRIDFRTLDVRPVPFALAGWTLAILDSGEVHAHADSGYNARRAECERARTLLGLGSLRDARPDELVRLPAPLDRRVRHVLEENARVDAAVEALHTGDLEAVGRLLDASHASLRDLYDASTGAVERAVERLRAAGAAGARMVGGGFGGHVLGLFPPGVPAPERARAVTPGAGARLLDEEEVEVGLDR
jgi:galactokinase